MRGLRTKTKAFSKNVAASDYDIVILTETWLTDQHLDSELFAQNFNVCRYDRKATIGGGVLIAANNDAVVSERIDIPIDDVELECVCVKLLGGKTGIFIYAFYIPPNAGREIYQRHMEAIDNIRMANTDTLMVIGDANAPNIEWTRNNRCENSFIPCGNVSNVYAEFLRFFPCKNMFQMINKLNCADNVLDLCYTMEPELAAVSYPKIPLSYPVDPHHTHFELLFEIKAKKGRSLLFVLCGPIAIRILIC